MGLLLSHLRRALRFRLHAHRLCLRKRRNQQTPIEKIQSEKISEKAKVVNLYRSIIIYVQQAAKQEPYLYSLGDRAEDIIKRFQEKQTRSAETLNNLLKIIKEITQSDVERNKLELSKDEFTLYWTLKESKLSNNIVELSKNLLSLLNVGLFSCNISLDNFRLIPKNLLCPGFIPT